MDKHYWKEIDVLYVLGILLVILGHSHSSDWSTFDGTPLVSLIHFIYLFHMAMFFCIAGFLFQNSDSLTRKGYPHWLKEKALRLLIPYLLWSFLALFPKYYFEHHNLNGLTIDYVLTSLFCPRQNIWGHFWFLPVLFLTYALFGCWKYANGGRPPHAWQTTLLLLLCVGFYFLPLHATLLGLSDLRMALLFFLLGILGCQVVSRQEKWIKHCVWFFGSLVILMVAWFLRETAHASRALGLPVAMLMILAWWCLASYTKPLPVVTWLSKNNFTIYLFSWMFQAAMMEVCAHFQCGWLLTSACMFLVGWLGPVVLILVFDRLPIKNCRFARLAFGFR